MYPHTGVAFTFSTDVSEEACWILLGCSSVETVPIIFQVGPHSAPRHRAGCGLEPLRSSPGLAPPPSSPKGLPSAGLELEKGDEGTAPPPPLQRCSVKLVADSFPELLSASGSWPGWGSRDSIGLSIRFGPRPPLPPPIRSPSREPTSEAQRGPGSASGDRMVLGQALSSQTFLGLALSVRGVR